MPPVGARPARDGSDAPIADSDREAAVFEAKHLLSVNELEEFEATHPPLPGHKVHSCTDVVWLLAALACLGAWVQVAATDFDPLLDPHPCEGEMYFCVNATPKLKGASQNGTLETHTIAEICGYVSDDIATNICHSSNNRYCVADHAGTLETSDCKFLLNPGGPAVRNDSELQALVCGGNLEKGQDPVAFAWPAEMQVILPFQILVACAAGYLYLHAFRKFAKNIVDLVQFGLVGGTAVSAFCLFPRDLKLILTDPCWTDFLGFCLLGLAALLWVLIRIMRRRFLDAAIGCIQATCECMVDEPAFFVIPLLSLLFQVLVAWVLIGCLVEHVARVALVFMSDDELAPFPLHFWCISIWILATRKHAVAYMCTWMTQMWYFTPYVDGRKQNKVPGALWKAHHNMIRYHLGTVALGSLLRLLLFPWGLAIMACAAPAADGQQNAVAQCLGSCCCCCIACYKSIRIYTSQLAYMDVALTSSGFCAAARRADALASESSGGSSIAWLKKGTHVFFGFSGNAFMAGVCAFSAYLVDRYLVPPFTTYDKDDDERFDEICKVAAASGILGFFVGLCFTEIVETLGLTIEYCVALDGRRRANVSRAREEYRGAPQNTYGQFFRSDSFTQEPPVAYAPELLQTVARIGDRGRRGTAGSLARSP